MKLDLILSTKFFGLNKMESASSILSLQRVE